MIVVELLAAFALGGAVFWIGPRWCDFLDRLADRRRHTRRVEFERRLRAVRTDDQRQADFHSNAVRLLRDISESDPGRAVGAIIDYGRNAANRSTTP